MSESIVPTSYEAWRHCIEQECHITLTLPYIAMRLNALQDPSDFHTQQFDRCWGVEHRKRVIGWFKQAESAMQSA